MESKHGNESTKHLRQDDNNSIDEDDALSPLISVGESDHDSQSEADVDINIDEKTPASGKKSRSSHHASSSSSSSGSSSDFFQIDAKMLEKSPTFSAESPNAKEDSQSPGHVSSKSQSPKQTEKNDKSGDISSKSQSPKQAEKNDKPGDTSFKSQSPKQTKKNDKPGDTSSKPQSPKQTEKNDKPGGISSKSQSPKQTEKNDKPGDMFSKSEDRDKTSPTNVNPQISHDISNPTSKTMSPIQLPPKQVMERSGDYDPDRIPASVFGSRPSSAMEWSVTSNDSLFSLNIGNNSFSREQFLMMSGELFGEDINKSGEVYNSGELNKPGETNKSVLPPLSPIGKLRKIRTMDTDKKPMDVNKKTKQTKVKDGDVPDFEEVKHELDGNENSSMNNRLSDGSATSSQSFAFPILVDAKKYTSVKGPFPRKQDIKLDVYAESPQVKTPKKKSSIAWRICCCCCYCCSQPECSCSSYRHCWSWIKKWCCCFCCFDYCSSSHCSCPSSCNCWSWKLCKKWCCCCC
ncbi:uncharacterized protein LOC141678826 [Apium graveolens]|uniref:uncharacterized protein LOC141678826 n=1 Tax=Apium graveolens TaxID=4045 RepID=UPI003D7A94DD